MAGVLRLDQGRELSKASMGVMGLLQLLQQSRRATETAQTQVVQGSGEKWPDSADGQMWRIKIPEQLEEWTVTELVKIEKRHF